MPWCAFSKWLSAYGRFFFCWDLRIGFRVRLWEVSVYRRLSIQNFLKEMAGTSGWCPLTEVSAYGRCPQVGFDCMFYCYFYLCFYLFVFYSIAQGNSWGWWPTWMRAPICCSTILYSSTAIGKKTIVYIDNLTSFRDQKHRVTDKLNSQRSFFVKIVLILGMNDLRNSHCCPKRARSLPLHTAQIQQYINGTLKAKREIWTPFLSCAFRQFLLGADKLALCKRLNFGSCWRMTGQSDKDRHIGFRSNIVRRQERVCYRSPNRAQFDSRRPNSQIDVSTTIWLALQNKPTPLGFWTEQNVYENVRSRYIGNTLATW